MTFTASTARPDAPIGIFDSGVGGLSVLRHIRARENLAKVKLVCAKRACPEIAVLTASIAKGPPIVTAAATVPAALPKAD